MNEVIDQSIVLLKVKYLPLRFLIALKAKFPNQVIVIRVSLILGFKIQSMWIIC